MSEVEKGERLAGIEELTAAVDGRMQPMKIQL